MYILLDENGGDEEVRLTLTNKFVDKVDDQADLRNLLIRLVDY